MRPPKIKPRYLIKGQWWRVNIVTEKLWDDPKNAGYCEEACRTIHLKKDDNQVMFEILLHELGHAINYECGLNELINVDPIRELIEEVECAVMPIEIFRLFFVK